MLEEVSVVTDSGIKGSAVIQVSSLAFSPGRDDEAVEQDGVVGGRVGEDIVRGVHVERTFRNP